jgi:immunoglobulin-like protein involved in spore germination
VVVAGASALGDRTAVPAGSAISMRGADTPAYVRFVVRFAGRLAITDLTAVDHSPFPDGTTRLLVRGATLGVTSPSVRAGGVDARLEPVTAGLRLRTEGAPRRLKYLAYHLLRRPDRLVVELWKARPPRSPLRIGSGRCLTLGRWAVGRGTVTVDGRERNLFEHMFLVQARDARGAVVGRRAVAARGGRWSANLAYRLGHSQKGTLEAVDFSEADGSLVCIAQVKVALRP